MDKGVVLHLGCFRQFSMAEHKVGCCGCPGMRLKGYTGGKSPEIYLFWGDQTILLRGFRGGLKGWEDNEI